MAAGLQPQSPSPGYEVAVGIVAVGQLHDVGRKAGIFQAQGELMGSLLAGLVRIAVKGDVDRAARST